MAGQPVARQSHSCPAQQSSRPAALSRIALFLSLGALSLGGCSGGESSSGSVPAPPGAAAI